MEKQLIDSPKPSVHNPFAFPPHRRRHLKSATSRTLFRIISHCYNQRQQLRPDDHGGHEPRQDTKRDGKEQIFFGNLEVDGLEVGGLSQTREGIAVVENLMRLDEDAEAAKEKELMGDGNGDGNGGKERGTGLVQQLLIKELEDVVKGNEESVRDGSCAAGTKLLEENESVGDGVGEVLKNQGACCDGQQLGMKECRDVSQEQVDEESCRQNVFEIVDSSLLKGVTSEASKPIYKNADEGPSLSVDKVGADLEMQQKEREFDKSVCVSGKIGSPSCMIEEGEISGEFEVDDWSVDMVSKDAVLIEEKKIDRKQASQDNVDQNKFPVSGKNEVNNDYSCSAAFMVDPIGDANCGRAMIANESARSEVLSKRKVVSYEDPLLAEEPVSHKKQKICLGTKEKKVGGGAMEEKKGDLAKDGVGCSTGSQGITTKELDAGLCNKKKRQPVSKERKAKKKQKERKQRAIKNRELGVKRLKLRPVVNPKPLRYCRHYLNGRCQEGEKCKFSHDTVPLTKSKPCCHFARHSCMKGDDCPFDHQLSKYPCTNFVSKGSCSRGENCMFSHKFPFKEDSSSISNACTPELRPPPLLRPSDSKEQMNSGGTSHQTPKDLHYPLGVMRCQNLEENGPKNVPTSPAVVPKGISFVAGGKSSVGSNHIKPSSSSLKSEEGGKVGNSNYHSASGTVQKLNEIPEGTASALASKGINFLSYSRSPLSYSSNRKLSGLSINGSNSVKVSLSNSLSGFKLASSSPNTNNSDLGKEAGQSASDTTPRLNEVLQKNELTVAAQKPNPFSCGEALSDSSSRYTHGRLPSTLGSGVGRSVDVPHQHHNPSVIPVGLPTSPIGAGQSLDSLARTCARNAPSTAPRALMPTLAFAAKVESEMKMNRSTIGSLALSSRVSKETGAGSTSGGSRNNSAEASRILDFLSSFGAKTKH